MRVNGQVASAKCAFVHGPPPGRVEVLQSLRSMGWLLMLSLLLVGCQVENPVEEAASASQSNPTNSPMPAPSTSTQTPRPTSTHTAVPSPSPTPTVRPTETWILRGPGALEVPILLYHRILPDEPPSRYTIAPDTFERQMAYLESLGCQTIRLSQLWEGVVSGAELPPHAVILTFDDGNADNYSFAFPIMQRFGFSGTAYLVANRIGAEGYLSTAELKEMISAGWEIGSHSMTHSNLTQVVRSEWRREVLESRLKLERELDVEVESFAYPFGSFMPDLAGVIEKFGYRTGMGLGTGTVHDLDTIYYLQRLEVLGSMDLDAFGELVDGCGEP